MPEATSTPWEPLKTRKDGESVFNTRVTRGNWRRSSESEIRRWPHRGTIECRLSMERGSGTSLIPIPEDRRIRFSAQRLSRLRPWKLMHLPRPHFDAEKDSRSFVNSHPRTAALLIASESMGRLPCRQRPDSRATQPRHTSQEFLNRGGAE